MLSIPACMQEPPCSHFTLNIVRPTVTKYYAKTPFLPASPFRSVFHPLAKQVFGRIRLNFVFAMLYNLCGVPVAAGVLYPFLHIRLPPALAGLSMALSSISVVLSSLALRFYRKPEVCLLFVDVSHISSYNRVYT